MKKRITLLLCFSILFCFTACGKAAVTESSTSSEPSSESLIDRVSMVDGSSFAYTAKVAYANAAGEGYNRIMSKCLNPEYMYMDSVQHWPLFKFETVQEMQDFKTGFADVLTFDSGYNEVPSFNHYAAEYDDAFFGDNTLLLCYVTASSGSYRFGVADVSVREDTLYLYVEQLNHPQVRTADVQGWFVLVEVRKADIEHCKQFDAQVYRPDVPDSVTADYGGDGEEAGKETLRYGAPGPEYAVSSFSNLHGKQGKETALSPEDNQAVTQLIGRQEFKESYDNLNDVILRDTIKEHEIYYDSGAGIITFRDSAVKLTDADKETMDTILGRYITLGVE